MRIITLNVNGIRAAERKGFYDWLPRANADVVCLQEVRAHKSITDDELFRPKGYHTFYCDAERKGYSGVAIYSRKKPNKVTCGLGWDHADKEGRYIQADFDNLSVASIYLPSGGSGEERQEIKFDFLKRYKKVLQKQIKSGVNFVVCGDINIVHKEIDIKNWKSNQKNSGCLPEERAWLDNLFDGQGWVDAFRVVETGADQYTWWSNRGRAWDNNVGWRIDYQIVSPLMKNKITKASVYKAKRFSDHSPLIVDYVFDL
jgi:exodeoxyribonuclease-3